MKIRAELTFPKELKEEPIFYEIIKRFAVVPTIIEASFSTDTGWAFVALEGAEEELERLFSYLAERGITADRRRQEERSGHY